MFTRRERILLRALDMWGTITWWIYEKRRAERLIAQMTLPETMRDRLVKRYGQSE
jgi:hypothetical protein